MKRIILLFSILALILLCSTITFVGGKVKIDANGKTTIDTLEVTSDYFLYEMPHCFFRYQDTTGSRVVPLDQNAWRALRPKGSTLTDVESHTINFTVGDSVIQYQGTRSCHMKIFIEADGTTTNQNDDIWIKVKNVTDNNAVAFCSRSSSGSGNYGTWVLDAYDIACNPNDTYVVRMCNKSNNNDFTIYRISIRFTVLHYEF